MGHIWLTTVKNLYFLEYVYYLPVYKRKYVNGLRVIPISSCTTNHFHAIDPHSFLHLGYPISYVSDRDSSQVLSSLEIVEIVERLDPRSRVLLFVWKSSSGTFLEHRPIARGVGASQRIGQLAAS